MLDLVGVTKYKVLENKQNLETNIGEIIIKYDQWRIQCATPP